MMARRPGRDVAAVVVLAAAGIGLVALGFAALLSAFAPGGDGAP